MQSLQSNDVFSTMTIDVLQSMAIELVFFASTVAVVVALSSASGAVVSCTKHGDTGGKAINQPSSPQQCSQTSGISRRGLRTVDRHSNKLPMENARAKVLSSRPSVLASYEEMMHSAAREGQLQAIEETLEKMVQADIKPPLALYESAMKILAGRKYFRQALAVYDRLQIDGLEPSEVTLSCLVSFATEIGEFDRAIWFFEQLWLRAMPSMRACMTVLRVHTKRQDWPEALKLFRDLQRRGVLVDSIMLNMVLACGVQVGDLDGVEALLSEVATLTPTIADIISYNTLMKGYAQQKQSGEAIDLLDRMRKRSLQPNAITLNTLMDATIRSSQVEVAWAVFATMQAARVAPDKYTCTILMKSFQHCLTFNQLSTIIGALQEVPAHCEVGRCSAIFCGVLEAAARLDELTLLTRAVQIMRDHRVVLTATEYENAIRICSEKKQPCCAIGLLEDLKESIAPKLPGASLYRDVILSCAHSDEIERGAELANEALEHGITISSNALRAVLDTATKERY